MSALEDKWVCDFPTLGFLAADWVEAHCVIPDGFDLGKPFIEDGWQLWNTLNHYRIKKNFPFDATRPHGAEPYFYRRSLIVAPQKTGKGPWAAAKIAFEAVGPSVFCGWAQGGEVYRCEDNGCGCGWEYRYSPGDPLGMPRPVALIQLVATSQEQTDNIYRPLQQMVRLGPLSEQMLVREEFIRLPNDGRVDPVTAAANSKLGNPITFAVMDEVGLYTKRNKLMGVAQTMRRGLAGIGGRAIETTNAWDPMDASTAQASFETRSKDVWKFYRRPPADLNYRNKRDRQKIHAYVYRGSPWVNLASIEAEAAELLETDPAQAERFFGNRLVQGQGAYMSEDLWDESTDRDRTVKPGEAIALGFDGSRSADWTAIRAETRDGFRFTPTYGPDQRPTFWNPEEWGGRIPRSEVDAAVAELFATYKVKRMHIDPRHWETQADQWANTHGEDVVAIWPTNQINRMFSALSRFIEDTAEKTTTHDGDETMKLHALAARKLAKPGDKYILGKPSENQKIDLLMADVLAHEAAADARSNGWSARQRQSFIRLA